MPAAIQFDWDPEKAVANIAKHGVNFEDAMLVFGDPLAITIPDPHPIEPEERWISIGMSRPPLLLLVVHTQSR